MEKEDTRPAALSGAKPPPGSMIPRVAVQHLRNCGKSVVWITAPAGSGKTTLAAQLCEREGQPFVWLRIEARMAAMGAFLSAFVAAFRKAFPKEALPALSSEDIAFPVDYLRRLIAAGGGRPMLIVLDDLHVLPMDAAPLQTLAEARRDVADFVRIVLVSRDDPHPAWLRFEADGLVERVGFETLRLGGA